MSYKYPKKVSI